MEVDVSDAPDQHLLEAVLDSWDRNNAIMLNLPRAWTSTTTTRS